VATMGSVASSVKGAISNLITAKSIIIFNTHRILTDILFIVIFIKPQVPTKKEAQLMMMDELLVVSRMLLPFAPLTILFMQKALNLYIFFFHKKL
jgi:hypothetical protein